MTSPRTIRRHAIVAVVAVCLLVLGGLGWATYSALQLERVEARAASERALEEQRRSYDQRRALALSRLDAVVAPALRHELAHRYEYFRPFYKPVTAVNEADGMDVSGSILLPSPLRTLRGPDWLLLRFQATATDVGERWSSPQLENENLQFATPVWAIPAEDRARQVSAAHWLAVLRERYTSMELLQKLEDALGAGVGQSQPRRGGAEAAAGGGETGRPRPSAARPQRLSRSAAEFVRRGARLVQMQNESYPGDLCLPEKVAFENLESGTTRAGPDRGDLDCVEVTATTMMPIWLDLTMDGTNQLALVRSVTVETSDFCTLQGVLIDWDRLSHVLEDEVRPLFPNARIVPVPADVAVRSGMAQSMMQTIPARLESAEPVSAETPEISTGFKVGLTVAWAATILALTAISYGTMKYVTHTERRMRFVSAVTHELRTPLTSFQLYADLLADTPPQDESQRRHHAETLRAESKRLARLVDNVLAYSHLEEAGPALRWRKVLPRTLLDAIGSATREQCGMAGKALVLENRCSGGLLLETDAQFVVQILTHLVENACKYGAQADDARVWLTASPAGDDGIEFEVDDAGPGVPPPDRRAVFQPFRRGDPDHVGRAGGLGLGLALSRYWAHCLGGRLTLHRSPRHGGRYTRFVLRLPITRPS